MKPVKRVGVRFEIGVWPAVQGQCGCTARHGLNLEQSAVQAVMEIWSAQDRERRRPLNFGSDPKLVVVTILKHMPDGEDQAGADEEPTASKVGVLRAVRVKPKPHQTRLDVRCHGFKPGLVAWPPGTSISR